MYKNKKLLVVGLVALVLGLVIGAGTVSIVSADEPEPKTVVLKDGTIVEAITSPGVKGVVLTTARTQVATDEVSSCPDYCEDMNCAFSVIRSRVLPANEPIRWWAGCECVESEGALQTLCSCSEESFCGRTRPAAEVGYFRSNSPTFYFTGRPVVVGQRGGLDHIAIARFRLVDISTEEIGKVVVSFDGARTDGLEDCGDAVFRVDLVSYATHLWPKQGYWIYTKNNVVGTIYEVSANYLRAVTDEDGRVPLGFRFPDKLVPGVEEAIAWARSGHPAWHLRWSLFVRWSLVNPPEDDDCILKFQNALLTVISE